MNTAAKKELATALGLIMPTSDTMLMLSDTDSTMGAASEAPHRYHLPDALIEQHAIATEMRLQFPTVICSCTELNGWKTKDLAALTKSDIPEVAESYKQLRGGEYTPNITAMMMMGLDFTMEAGSMLMIAPRKEIQDYYPTWHGISNHVWLWIDIPTQDGDLTALYFSRHHAQYTLTEEQPRRIASRGLDYPDIKHALGAFREEFYNLPRGPHIHINAAEKISKQWDAMGAEKARRDDTGTATDHISIGEDGFIQASLRSFDQFSGKYTPKQQAILAALDGKHFASLIVQQSTRQQLLDAITGDLWQVSSETRSTIQDAIVDSLLQRAPFFTPNDSMSLGWVDELTEIEATSSDLDGIESGKKYPITTWIRKVNWDDQEKNIAGDMDKMHYSGRELIIGITSGIVEHHFHVRLPEDKPATVNVKQAIIHNHHAAALLDHFKVTPPKDISELMPEEFAAHSATLDTIEQDSNKS